MLKSLGNTTLAKLLTFAQLVYLTPNMPFEFLLAWLSLCYFSFCKIPHFPLPWSTSNSNVTSFVKPTMIIPTQTDVALFLNFKALLIWAIWYLFITSYCSLLCLQCCSFHLPSHKISLEVSRKDSWFAFYIERRNYKEHGCWNKTVTLVTFQLTSCMTVGEWPRLCKSQFSHLWNRNNKRCPCRRCCEDWKRSCRMSNVLKAINTCQLLLL